MKNLYSEAHFIYFCPRVKMIVEKAALGNVTTYTYDLNGNLISMTDALGQTVSLEYDKNGNATACSDAGSCPPESGSYSFAAWLFN